MSIAASARLPFLAGAVLAFQALGFCAPLQAVSQQATWASADAGVVLDLHFPVPGVETTDGGMIVRLPGEGLIGEPGAPDLPLVNRLVRIPDRSDVQLTVQSELWLPWETADVHPVQDRVHTAADLPLPWAEQPAIYGGAAWWPAQAVTLGEPMILRDKRLVKVGVAPVRWNPATRGMERLEHLELRLDFTGENPVNCITHPLPPSPVIDRLLGADVIAPPPDETPAGVLDAIDWVSADLPLDYLVYTPAAALDNIPFRNWLEWKHRMGHRVTVITGDDIAWNATSIRNSIIAEAAGDTPPDYVMLVGDVDGGSFITPTHPNQYDHFYATIAGNDVLADLVVGRISVRSASHLSTVFNKIMAYEQNPDLANSNWLHRASFLTGQGHCGLSMSQLSRAAGFSLVDHYGYTQIDTAFCARSPDYVYTWYNQGTSFHNYRGISGMEGLSTGQIMGLAQGRRTPIAVIFTCNSGDFAESFGEPAFTEAFLRAGNANTPGGAAAAMGFCTPNTHTAYNNIVCGGFWYGVLDLHIRQVGTAMFRGKYELYRSLPEGDANIGNFSSWANLMGDPGMNVWVGEPDVLQLDEAPVSVSAGDTRLAVRITTTDGTAVEGAVVCASQRDGFRVLVHTDSDGRAVLTLPAMEAGEPLWLTATRDDHVPVLRDYTLTSAASTPALSSPVYNSAGGPYAVPGMATSLGLTVTNPTAGTLTGGVVTLELEEGAGSIQQATSALPSIPAGQSASLSTLLQFTPASAVTGDPLWLDLTLDWSGGNRVQHRLRADMRHPLLELVNPDVSGLVLEPGESGTLQIQVRNSGLLDGTNMQLHASFPTDSPFGTPDTPIALDLAAGELAEGIHIPVSLGEDGFRGLRSTLHVEWTDGSVSGAFDIPVGSATGSPTDPTGPDAYGYYAWENGDNGPLAMDYAWVEIAPAAGGSGTLLNLSDHGDEQDDAMMVTLPFAFTLYGESHTQMSVCSNGFVSFGTNSHLETDFRNHFLPGAMGPEPMLAVMWDDHKLTNGAQVCVQYMEENHFYVVEWYRVRGNSSGGPNTFQLLLLDPGYYPTPSGDSEFIYQYHTFANTQANSQDFPYCSIGLEDHTGTRGLTLSNYNAWPDTATPITSTRSIRFSTRLVPPSGSELQVLTDGLAFVLPEDEPGTAADTLRLLNTGNGLLNFNLRVVGSDTWPPAGHGFEGPLLPRDQGGPDGYGYAWIDSGEEEGPEYAWVDTPGALPVSFTQNDAAAGPFAIGFPMQYYGVLYDSLYINPNGYLSFTDAANHWNNSVGLPHPLAPDNSLCAWWDDLLQDNDLNDYVTRHHTPDSLVVSWNQAPHSSPNQFGGPFTFQFILERSGRITLQYGDMSSSDPDSRSGTIGIQGPDPSLGLQVQNMTLARSYRAIRITPPFWLDLPVVSGLLGAGESAAIPVLASNHSTGSLLDGGLYGARIVVRSGDRTVDVPVSLAVGDVAVEPGPPQADLPSGFSLGEAWPNPFNPLTRVEVQVADSRPFSLNLFNLQGRLVAKLVDSQTVAPGRFTQTIDGIGLASGVYLLQLDSPAGTQVRKLMLIK